MRRLLATLLLLSLAGCAGLSRSCSSYTARSFGGDWIVVQFDMAGKPFNCWRLSGVSIVNEEGSDGIYWKDSSTGHLVHISGWYNRVQVDHSNFAAAARLVGVDLPVCGNGRYPAEAAKP